MSQEMHRKLLFGANVQSIDENICLCLTEHLCSFQIYIELILLYSSYLYVQILGFVELRGELNFGLRSHIADYGKANGLHLQIKIKKNHINRSSCIIAQEKQPVSTGFCSV